MNRLIHIWIFTLTLPGFLHAVEIRSVESDYMEAEEVLRLSDYVGALNTGRRLVLRTQENEFPGVYYKIALDSSLKTLPDGTIALLEYLSDSSPDPLSIEFPLPGDLPGGKMLFIGLTGDDWRHDELSKRLLPTAWRISLIGPDGFLLAKKNSFVWGTR